MKARKMPAGRVALTAALLILALVLIPAAFAKGKPGGGGGSTGTSGSGCSISPGQVVLDQAWTTSAWGLPTSSTVNLIITFPNGGQWMGAISVASNGTYTASGNSNMSASWGFIAPEQTGTYTYQFVNQIKWPAGTFTKSFAKCAVLVS
jgi:hypothetical protein